MEKRKQSDQIEQLREERDALQQQYDLLVDCVPYCPTCRNSGLFCSQNEVAAELRVMIRFLNGLIETMEGKDNKVSNLVH